jgi:hypothetical protein
MIEGRWKSGLSCEFPGVPMNMNNFFQYVFFVYLFSPVWVLVVPVISSHRIYRLISYAVCFVLFTVFPITCSLQAHNTGDFGGLVMLLCLGVDVFATVFAAVLLIVCVWKKKSIRFFYGVMISCAVVGFLGSIVVRQNFQGKGAGHLDVETIMAQYASTMTFPEFKLSDVLTTPFGVEFITTAAGSGATSI